MTASDLKEQGNNAGVLEGGEDENGGEKRVFISLAELKAHSLTEEGTSIIVYGHTKAMNEVVARRYTERFGLDTRALRPASVFGYGRTTGRSAEVSRMIRGAALDGKFTSTQSPRQTSSLVHVDDVAEMFARLCLADGLERDIYVSGGTTASLEEVAGMIVKHLPDAEISFPEGVAPYPNLRTSDGGRLARDIQYRLPDIRSRIADTIAEARLDRGMSPSGRSP